MDVRLVAAFVVLAISSSLTVVVPVSGADAGTRKSSIGSPPAEHHHPQNWRFTLPKGDAVKGRTVFTKYECYYCHEVRGEDFDFAGVDYGPELSQMGPLHPLEYFAESIMNPNAVVSGAYRGADGKSTMPSYNEKMTVQELIDVSTYLASLKPATTAKSVKGVGKIVALVPPAKEVVIDHEAIKDYMDAMTMGYKVSSPSLLKGLNPGDRVEFTLDTAQRVITKIDKLKP
jgi:Cu/Ag efflux protein CusF